MSSFKFSLNTTYVLILKKIHNARFGSGVVVYFFPILRASLFHSCYVAFLAFELWEPRKDLDVLLCALMVFLSIL